MVLEMILVATLGGGSPWDPPQMIGAILLGQQAAPPPATFDFGIVFVGMLIHFLLSVVLAFRLPGSSRGGGLARLHRSARARYMAWSSTS